MKLNPLTSTAAPHQHALVSPASESHDALSGLTKHGCIVRFVRGKKAETVSDFYDEISAAMQFPFYFGGNWDAFADCIGDLEWLNAKAGVIVVFTDAAHLLKAAPPADAVTLKRILTDACARWNGPEKTPFHVVFQTESKEAVDLLKRWPGLETIV